MADYSNILLGKMPRWAMEKRARRVGFLENLLLCRELTTGETARSFLF